MDNRIKTWIFILVILSPLLSSHVDAQTLTGKRAQWFVNDRFGMFIHWGLYSGAEGIWKGEKLRFGNDYAEWIQYRNRISKEEYVKLAKRFDWNTIDPEKWVLLAKAAGMKYVTLTAKHHDGFALWHSHASDYNVWNYSNPQRDIVKELAQACKKHGLKMGLYYSHWVDWEHPYGWDHTKEIHPISTEEYDQYWQEKVIPQIRELLTNYGDIGILWFDMWVDHSQTVVTKKQLLQLKNLIRELQPHCLVNSRLGLSIEEDPDVDFRTLGDNQLGKEKLEYPWQTPGTVAHSWGFNSYENQWKSTTTLLRSLIGNVSLNGNFMLNIGPRANGEMPYEITTRLKEIGQWLRINGESIYGSGAFDLRSDQHDWGSIICKKTESGKFRLYAHVFNWPLNRQLTVTGIKKRPLKVYLLADKSKSPLPFYQEEVVTQIKLPRVAPDPYVSVVVLEYDEKPEVEKGLVAETGWEGFSLKPNNAVHSVGTATWQKAERFGSIPEHALIKEKQSYTWRIYIPRPRKLRVGASYSFQGKVGRGSLVLKMGDKELKHTIQPTGKTVGEPGSKWTIDNFSSNPLGELNIKTPGYYTVSAEIVPKKGDEIKLNWIWLGTD